MPAMASQIEIITALRAQVLRLEAANRTVDDSILKTPWKGLNRILPQGGICRGRLMEWIGSGLGSGAGTLALLVGRQVCADGGTLVVVDRPGCFYPPAALALGILREQLLIVRPTNDADEIWAIDQSLRCEAVSVVWSYTERLPARAFRRLQLSAEEGRGIGMLIRPPRAQTQPGWSHVRLLVQPLGSSPTHFRWQIEMLRALEGNAGGRAEIEIALNGNIPP
jgi:protein ImuA